MRLLGERRSSLAQASADFDLLRGSMALANTLALIISGLYEVATQNGHLRLGMMLAMGLLGLISLALRVPRWLDFAVGLKLFADVFSTTLYVTFVVLQTGGPMSPLLSLYLLPIVLAAMALSSAYLLSLLALITLFYFASAWLTEGLAIGSLPFLARTLGTIGPFYIVGWLTSELGHQLLAARRRERQYSNSDPLTGLASRAAFNDAVDAERQKGARTGLRYSILLIRIEPLVSEKDDDVEQLTSASVKLVASVLTRALRDSDLAARLDEHTFVALLRGADLGAAQTAANRIRHAAHAATMRIGNRIIRIQAQCAPAQVTVDGTELRDLLAAAELRLANELVRRQNARPLP